MYLEGIIKTGTRTKELVRYLSINDIAIIQHDDIDELAAEALISTGVKAIINTGCSMTGRYASKGTSLLVSSNVMLFDTNLNVSTFKDGDYIKLRDRDLLLNNNHLYTNSCFLLNIEYIENKLLESSCNYELQLSNFIDNTIQYAGIEKNQILTYNCYPDLNTSVEGRCAIVVARSSESKDCLLKLKDYINREKPILIGVDGGADIIISCGFAPDILIGDMDSVSDVGIYKSKDLILHAYTDGSCPCQKRIEALNIKYKLLPMKGTSEDIALLLAYDKGASYIVLIGGHSCMTDFLDKGRPGMGSTLITRFKVADRLIDYRYIIKLQCLMDNKNAETFSKTEGDLVWMKM